MQNSETSLEYILDTDLKKSNCSNDEPIEIKVYQYNILAQSLTGVFEVESSSYVKKENREDLLKNSFLKMIAENAIICLQEVENEYFCNLFTFFRTYDYTIVFSAYGGSYCGNMGIAIAVPSKYTISELSIKYVCNPLSKLKKKAVESSVPQNMTEALIDTSSKIMNKVYSFYQYAKSFVITPEKETPPLPNPWLRVKGKWNTTIMMKLMYEEKEFCVATVHYPCEFFNPNVMNIFHILLMKQLQEFAGDLPCVLAGDFNFKPDNILYQLIKGSISKEEWDNDEQNPNNDIKSMNEIDMIEPIYLPDYYFNSIYDGINDLDEQFTNNSKWKGRPIFKGVIDYIFYRNINLKFGMVVNDHNDKDKLLPNEAEPSDHCRVHGTFELN